MSKVTPTSNEVKKTLTIVDRSTKALNTAADSVIKVVTQLVEWHLEKVERS